ncbi:unnamed protein product [Kluyveromyces dobzhanskii CBS 2104]|uniref:WGS project CCBQ000000000 data, contig 00010 n=1 Tax=Kluyveromyces dobzhanskii CBS 2104 TaxID=1427455 RepID=A0A0A8LCS8_9SACH|nr:unnamed protein product [Kluyveromyces dobzhanskii CBS 2104]
MSGSFWKFGQDYANEAPLTKLLNKAFFKVGNGDKNTDTVDKSSSYGGSDSGRSLRGKKSASELTSESDSDCISGEDDSLDAGEGLDAEKRGHGEDGDNDDDDRALRLGTTNRRTGHFNDNGEEDEDLEDEDEEEEEEEGEEEEEEEEEEGEQVSISESNFEYKDYRPNLDILDDLLDDEELYTELMCSNFKLLVFFRYPEVLAKLVDYVTNEHVLELDETLEYEDQDENASDSDIDDQNELKDDPANEESEGSGDDSNNQSQYQNTLDSIPDNASESSAETSITLPPESEEQVESRRARIAAEILSADVWTISSAFMDNEDLLVKLWSTLEHHSPLSIIASTYFMKINERLLDMDISGMISFILKQENIVDRFIAHIDNPPLMDFLLKVISTDKPDAPTGIISLLKKQHLIPKLLEYLSIEHDSAIQSAAGDFLKALITISANSNNEIASAIGPNELTRELVSEDMVTKLVDIMLQGGTSLSNGVGIVIELIRKNNSDYDFVQVMYTTLETHPPSDRDPVYLGHLVRCFAKMMDRFNKILLETKLDPLETPFGTIEPLGFERFKICELVAELLHCSNMGLLGEASGEAIVHERDVKRQEILKEMEKHIYDENLSDTEAGYFSQESQPIALQKDLQDLDINTTSNETDVADDLDDVEDAGGAGDADASLAERADIHSETSSDSEVTEKSLRENPVVGDLLKISLQDNFIITTILDMFFRFPWNNFLHNVVFDIVQQIFNGPLKSGYNKFLLADLFSSAHITEVIMEGDSKCLNYEKETGIRLGYMGHLTLIAEEVAKFAAYIEEANVTFSSPIVQDGLNEPKWKEYCDTILTETREKYSSLLGDDGIDDAENDEGDDEIYEDDDINENQKRFMNANGLVHSGDADEDEDPSELGADNCYIYEDNMGNKTKIKVRLDGDENDSSYDGDLNKFSNYMSNQIKSGLNMADNGDDEGEAEEEDDIWNGEPSNTFQPQIPNKTFFNSSMFHSHQFDLSPDDEEDYLDPNDDGQSYAKPNHPLYSSMLSPGGLPYSTPVEDINDIGANEEDADEDDEDDVDADEDIGLHSGISRRANEYSLHRTSSNDKIPYDLADQSSMEMGMPSLQRSSSHDTD